MSNFVFALNASVPIFLVIVVGWFIRQINLVDDHFVSVLNKYVFRVALPVMLFKDIATTPIDEVYDPKFIIFCMICSTIMFAGVWAFAEHFIKDKTEVGAFTQAAARGSAAILGIAFVENIYGNSGMAPMMVMSVVPLYNVYSVIILSNCARRYPLDGSTAVQDYKKTDLVLKSLKEIVTNPLILGIFLGLPFSFLRITLPPIALKTVTSLGSSATPMALIAVGASFEGRRAIKKIRTTALATIIKLMIIPAVFFPFAIALGFKGSALVAILIMAGSPTTVSCYIMAKNMGNDDVLTSSVIVTATLFSSVSLTFWLFIIKSMGLI